MSSIETKEAAAVNPSFEMPKSPHKDATDATFDDLLREEGGSAMAYFWAGWSEACRTMAPSVEALPVTSVIRVDAESCPRTTAKYEVRGTPCCLLFQHGEAVAMVVGAMTPEALAEWIGAHIAAPKAQE